MKKYYKCRYNYDAPDDDSNLAKLLYYTGGIGKVVNAFWEEGIPWKRMVEHCFMHEPSCACSELQRVRQVNLLNIFCDKRSYFALVPALIASYQSEKCSIDIRRHNAMLLPQDVSIPLRMLLARAQVLTEEIVLKWVDMSLLYLHVNERDEEIVHLARPCDVLLYFAADATHADDYRRLVFASEMIHGLKEEKFLDAGFHVEALMRPRLWFSLNGKCDGNCYLLQIQDERELHYSTDGGKTFMPVSAGSVAVLAHKTWRWQAAIGIDGLQFVIEGSHIKVYLWQRKSGRLYTTVGGGNPAGIISKFIQQLGRRLTGYEAIIDALAADEFHPECTAIAAARGERGGASLLFGDSVGGHQAKAALGVCYLVAALLRSVPGATASLERMYLTISKMDTPEGAAEEQAGKAYDIPDELLAATSVEAEVASRWLAPRRLRTELYLGDDWIRKALEPDLLRLWPS